jgi:dienelactone hydrolase
MSATGTEHEVRVDVGSVALPGVLALPPSPAGIVLFAHGSGSSRHSPRNRAIAGWLVDRGCGTLLFDLLTEPEATDRRNVFDIPLLGDRMAAATRWLEDHPAVPDLPVGYFGASTGAAAALIAAAAAPAAVAAVVSRGGRPDLAGDALPQVEAPTLLIVGSRDETVLELNRSAQARLRCDSRLAIVPGATHLFEEPGTLEQAGEEAGTWFLRWFGTG